MTRNSRRNLPKQLTSLNHHDTNHKHYDDFSAAAKAMTRMATAAKQQHKQQHDYQSPNPNHNRRPNSETLERGRRRRFRFLVASLGLTVAAVNCYAQATFCIAIVEMVLPADYVFKGESGSQTVRVVASDRQSSSSIINGAVEDLEPESLSCPVEYKYRDYYDEWRFPNVSSQISASSSSSSSRGSLVNLLRPPSVSTDDGEPKSSRHHVLDISNRFDWDASRQGLLLGAFAMGMAPLQVLGGRLAELYGAKWVLLAGCLGTALTNLTIPVLAHFSYTLLVINRVAMGVAQAGMEPGLMCLMAQWLAPAETGFFISMLLFALCIGFFLGSLLSSFLLALGLGWPITYYVTGALNLIMGLVWLVYASKGPEESGLISDEELAYIKHEQQQERAKEVRFESQACSDDNSLLVKNDLAPQLDGKTTTLTIQGSRSLSAASSSSSSCPSRRQGSGEAPWMNILRTPSVWAFIICKISVRWCADVLTIELPTYLANVLHLSIKLNGILNSLSSAFFAIFSFITGYIVNELLKRTHEGAASERERILNANNPTAAPQPTSVMSKTTLRKVFQSVASFGSAIAIFLMTHYDCNIQLSMSMMFVLSACLMMGTGGELQIPYDMTPRYPGTLHGMACTLSVSGWLAPPLIGLILGDQPSSRHRWSIVWYLTASINFIGGLVFVLFADASPRNFDKPPRSPEEYHKKVSQLPPDCCAAGKISSLRQNGSCASVGPTTTAPPATKAALLRCHGLEPDSTCSGIESRGRGFSSAIMAAQPLFAPATEQRPSNAVKCSSFDGGELLKIRQLEGSLLPSGSRLDSLIAGELTDVMFPYQQSQPGSDNGFSSPFAWLTGARRSRQRKRQLSGTLMCQRQDTSLPSSAAQDRKLGKIITRL